MMVGVEDEEQAGEVIRLLVWFGFLGVLSNGMSGPRYSHNVRGNMRRLLFPLEMTDASVVIHPAFRSALNVDERS
jgi:hypothetical protein